MTKRSKPDPITKAAWELIHESRIVVEVLLSTDEEMPTHSDDMERGERLLMKLKDFLGEME